MPSTNRDDPSLSAANLMTLLPAADRQFASESASGSHALLENINKIQTSDFNNLRTDYSGIAGLVYPRTTSLVLAWDFVLLGRAYAAEAYLGASARSYWTAIGLASQTFGSRPDREYIRYQAFVDLSAIAHAKHEDAWALELSLMADLHKAYLDSVEAEDDDQAFYAEVAELRNAVQESDSAQQQLQYSLHTQHTHSMLSGLLVGLSAANAGLTGNSADLDRANAAADQAAATETADETRSQAAANHLGQVVSALSTRAQQFKVVIAQDVDDIQAGRSMLAEEYAGRSTQGVSDDIYGPVLQLYRARIPELSGANSSDEIARALRAFELRAAKERSARLLAARGRSDDSMPVATATAAQISADEVQAWQVAEGLGTVANYQNYLSAFPNGVFAARAQHLVDDPVAVAKIRRLQCPSVSSDGGDLELHGDLQYSAESGQAEQSADWQVHWGVINNSDDGYSGSLKVALWALPNSFNPSYWTGFEVAELVPNFTGDGAQSATQLRGSYSVTNISGSARGTNPPIGKYCMVLVLYEYSTSESCHATDHYCWGSYSQFPGAVLFR
jgi:hypothetical protein